MANTLAAADVGTDSVLLLFSDDKTLADLAAIDLREAGLPLVVTPDFPPDEARIDYLFLVLVLVHDRHDGNLAAARGYLEWETGPLAQCAPDELGVFRIGAPG